MSNKKYKIFISSVQNEFEQERAALADFIFSDALLRSFFQPFIFERISATSSSPEQVFLKEVEKSDIYIGILGKSYGYEDEFGVSPSEKEYNAAKSIGIPRWIYILKTSEERHKKEEVFIRKVSDDVSWKFFTNTESLKKEVYNTCVEFLQQKGKIENSDFDNSLHSYANLDDLDTDLIQEFINNAREKRNFPEKLSATKSDVLKRLNLIRDGKVCNSALLVFSSNPQQFFPTATVKCAHFHGNIVQKPISDYKEFTGTVFEMADQALDFVLSKISISTGTRDRSNYVDTVYEIPRSALSEAIINALAHRDYYSKGSVQISVFKDRIEIENPGHLPNEITVEDLKHTHASYPNNPLLANCLFLTGAIDRYGTGTLDIIRNTTKKGLPEPEFTSRHTFKVTFWRKAVGILHDKEKEQVGDQDREQVRDQVKELIFSLSGEMSATEIMAQLSLKARRNFLQNYLQPAVLMGYIAMTEPDKPTIGSQKYYLTANGDLFRNRMFSKYKFDEISKNTQEITDEPTDEIRMKFGINSDEIRNKFGVNILKTVELIAQNPEITAEAIAEKLKLTQRTIENYLAKLKENGYLERLGSKKDGRYIIIKRKN